MPGILPSSESTSGASMGSKVASDVQPLPATVDGSHRSETEEYRYGDTLTNGDHRHVNGTRAGGISTSSTDDQRKTVPAAIGSFLGQLPPEIEHITYGYTEFSLLVSRLVQETFLSLTEVITDMSDMPVFSPDQNAPTNGLNHFTNGLGVGDTSGGNVQKKLRMLNFASNRRAQFIKILILLGWARQADAVSKVIDLNVWTNWRLHEYKESISWVGELKRILGPLRDPNPDIETALEVLSLGKASWLPDLEYLPPESQSPHQLLQTLERINVLLAIRLNLHEVIPPAFKNFSISSGRVTFSVPEEFEVELSIADEDLSSQLYFVDFRFLFSPTPSDLPTGGLRETVQNRANELLMRGGLNGLFDFLHNFTLTHKLSVLRNQAFELTRGYWSEQLRVEAVHRSVVVQYWLNRPGGRNWIEMGLNRGKQNATSLSLRSQKIPHIGLRWFRGGKEVVDHGVKIRPGDLSLVDILKQVLALHTSYIFEQIVENLRQSELYSKSSLRLKCSPSATEPLDASLLVQLTTSKAVKVVQEPVSGKFSILPASQLNSRAEYELNRVASPATEGASKMAYLRSFTSQDEVELGARSMGWDPVPSLNPNEVTTERLFTKDIQSKKFFRRPSWNFKWVLAFTASLGGDHWWIVELTGIEPRYNPVHPTSVVGPMLQSAYKIVMPEPSCFVLEPSYAKLADIENTAAGMISQFVDTRVLLPYNYPHKIQSLRRKGARTRLGSIFIRFSSKKSPFTLRSDTRMNHLWLEEVVRLDYYGLDSSRSQVIHVAHVHMQQSIPEIQDLLSLIPSIAFEPANENLPGAVKFQFATRVGEPVVPSLKSRLQMIRLLLEFASTIKSHGLRCNAASLGGLAFDYTTSRTPLTATVNFPEDAPKHISLSKLNPHLRIIDHLTESIRSNGLTSVIGTLRMTLSLLRTFSIIEAGQDNAGFHVLARSDQWYQVRYSEPYSKSSFDIRLRNRRDDAMWFIPETSIKKPEFVGEEFEHGLKAVTRGKGEGWRGMSGGVIANIKGVEQLITKMDEVFRTSKLIVGDPNPRKRKAENEIVELD